MISRWSEWTYLYILNKHCTVFKPKCSNFKVSNHTFIQNNNDVSLSKALVIAPTDLVAHNENWKGIAVVNLLNNTVKKFSLIFPLQCCRISFDYDRIICQFWLQVAVHLRFGLELLPCWVPKSMISKCYGPSISDDWKTIGSVYCYCRNGCDGSDEKKCSGQVRTYMCHNLVI